MTAQRRRRLTKEAFARWMRERFLLRSHMTVILFATVLAGLAVTKAFVEWAPESLALRYAAAVAAAYGVFLLLVRAWLWYIQDGRPEAEDVVDAVDLTGDVMDSLGGPVADPQSFTGSGGGFGGGGASGDFGTASAAANDGGSADWLSDVTPDGEGFVVLLVLAVLAVVLAASGLYLVYSAPAILVDVAFEALLASAIVRGARRGERAGWLRAVVRSTILPFLGVFVAAVLFGWLADRHCPGARRALDVIRCVGA